MKMNMPDKLSRRSAVVAQDIIALGANGLGNRLTDPAEAIAYPAQNLGRTMVQLLKMLLWNNQRVSITDRTNIQKSQ
jgi:lysophospholipase L1-like esterase